MHTPKIIKQLILVNVVFFALSMISPKFFDLFAMHFPLNPQFRWWQVITHMFMHGGIWHILFNMYALWAFGSPIVARYGVNRFLAFYFISGLGALALFLGVEYYRFTQDFRQLAGLGIPAENIWAVLQHPDSGTIGRYFPQLLISPEVQKIFDDLNSIYHLTMLGASGAIYGILVAFAFFYPRVKLMLIFLPYPLDAKYFVPLLILMDIVFGFTNYLHTNIAHFAHVGGALTGLLLLWFWRNRRDEYYFYD